MPSRLPSNLPHSQRPGGTQQCSDHQGLAPNFPIEFPTKGWLQISHRISHLTKSPLDGPAAQLLLLGAGVGLGDALLALEHLGAGGEEEAGLGKGEAGKVRLMLVRRSVNLPAAKYVRKAHRGSSWQAARQSLMEATT